MMGTCSVQTQRCVARTPAAITAVWTVPGARQIDVCSACLDEQIRTATWVVEGARSSAARSFVTDQTPGTMIPPGTPKAE
jgi:hypothetical protein